MTEITRLGLKVKPFGRGAPDICKDTLTIWYQI